MSYVITAVVAGIVGLCIGVWLTSGRREEECYTCKTHYRDYLLREWQKADRKGREG